MASLFGLPLDAISNLSDSTAHLAPDQPLKEKMVFVGGLYQEKHDNVHRLFFVNVTDTTHIREQTYVMMKLFALILSIVILFCQTGFACLHSGASRKSSVVTPFVVNAVNLGVSAFAFWTVGYAIARTEGNFVLGTSDWFATDSDTSLAVDWFLYFTLALTVANIASSGGLERCPLWITAVVSAVLSGVVYPLIIHWIWHYNGWMLRYTFHLRVQYEDHGGSGPIHAVGGAAALVATLALGPRDEKEQPKGSKVVVNDIDGHSVPLEVLGGYLVTICILCINIVRGLSTFLGTDPTGSIGRGLMNTVISSAVCCLMTILLSAILKRFMGEWRFHWLPARMIMNSILIGAVSVSGGCTLFSQWASAVIGIFASIGYIIWTGFLSFAKVDDVTGSITVHLGGGLLGATCAPVFKRDIGLVFTENTELAAMSLLWNLVCVLSMIALTMIVVGAVMILPTMLQVIPLSAVQQLQGLDFLYLKQEAYSGFAFTPFNTDVFEDRETFSDSRQTTPLSQQAMGLHLGYPQAYDNDGMYPTDDPEAHLEGLKGLSSSSLAYTSGSSLPGIHRYLPDQRDITFHNSRDLCSPGDRHVWFGDDMLEPEFPLVPLDERVDDSRINAMRRLEYC